MAKYHNCINGPPKKSRRNKNKYEYSVKKKYLLPILGLFEIKKSWKDFNSGRKTRFIPKIVLTFFVYRLVYMEYKN
jgi:hypothetical protein